MLNYKIYNQSKKHNVPCLVFIAGFTGTYETWNLLVTELINHSKYQILLIDNLGAGNSSQPCGKYTTPQMADEILKVLYMFKFYKIYLVGHSLGGAIAQYIGLKNHELIQHLFLISSFIKLDHIAKWLLIGRSELCKLNVSKQVIAINTIPQIFANKFISSKKNREFATQRIINNPQTIDGMLGQLNACLKHDTSKIISTLECNTSIITGQEDILVHPKHAQQLHKKIYNSKLYTINNIGHMVQLECPEKLANIIINTVSTDE